MTPRQFIGLWLGLPVLASLAVLFVFAVVSARRMIRRAFFKDSSGV